jgi:hypothetical protein
MCQCLSSMSLYFPSAFVWWFSYYWIRRTMKRAFGSLEESLLTCCSFMYICHTHVGVQVILCFRPSVSNIHWCSRAVWYSLVLHTTTVRLVALRWYSTFRQSCDLRQVRPRSTQTGTPFMFVTIVNGVNISDRLCGLVVRDPGFDSWR